MKPPTIRQRVLVVLAESPRPLRATVVAQRTGIGIRLVREALTQLYTAGEADKAPSCGWLAVRR